jgi:hypothetical protein
MQNLENNENELTPLHEEIVTKVTKKTPSLTSLEASVIARSEDLNEPALCAMFELTHDELTKILAKK